MKNESESVIIRSARIEDSDMIVDLVKKLGIFEKALPEDITVTSNLIEKHIFINRYCEVLIAEINNNPAGLCTFYFNFFIRTGKPGIIIEDFFVLEKFRRQGVGLKLFQQLAIIALQRGCEKIEWACLAWNESALNFYKKIGAKIIEDSPQQYILNRESL